ncbi:hypothetical protein ACQH8C_26470, partial [Escherichia coli]
SHIIASKTKLEKDSFFAQILHEASNEAGGGLFYRFWENWGNARMNGIGENREREQKGRRCTTCILARDLTVPLTV